MFRDFLKFASSTIGAVVTMRVTFPFARELLNITMLPPSSSTDLVELVTSIICAFVLMAAFIYGSTYRVSIRLAVFAVLIALACLFGYQYAIGPNSAIISLGVSGAVAADYGYSDTVLLPLYFGIFASFTGAFTLLTTYLFNQSRGSNRRYR
jgi:hypothetical protein